MLYPTLQPNGLFALWDEKRFSFTAFDLTPDQAVERAENTSMDNTLLRRVVDGIANNGGLQMWNKRTGYAINEHGESDPMVVQALERTPDQTIARLQAEFLRATFEADRAAFAARALRNKAQKLGEQLTQAIEKAGLETWPRTAR